MPDELIFNRTSDCFYNASDLNRVEDWLVYLVDGFSKYGVDFPNYTRKTWVVGEPVFKQDIDRIKTMLYSLYNTLGYNIAKFTAYFSTAFSSTMGVYDWNLWEELLSLANDSLGVFVANYEKIGRQAGNALVMEAGGVFNT